MLFRSEAEILRLFDERQEVLFEDSVDIKKLNDIDIQLTKLGVEFLTTQEVAEQFPEAKAIRETAISGITNADTASDEVVTLSVVPPGSNTNTWASYRYSNVYYSGNYYNVQKLIAQPISESSELWEEGARTVNYSINWKAGVTELLKSLAWSGAGAIASIPVTVYDALASMWSGLRPVSDIDPCSVYYAWETQTTASFSYVRLESQSYNYQWLSFISTKCVTQVAYVADVDNWRQNGSGAWIPYPALTTGSRYLYHTPSNYYGTSQAIYAYLHPDAGASNSSISSITISGPESKTIQTIYPCYPSFPLGCE